MLVCNDIVRFSKHILDNLLIVTEDHILLQIQLTIEILEIMAIISLPKTPAGIASRRSVNYMSK